MSEKPTYAELELRVLELEKVDSERKQAEAALWKSEKRIQSVFRSAPAGIGVTTNRIIDHANVRLCEMTGYSSGELVGQSARLLYPSDKDFEYVGREKYAQIRDHGTGTVETRWRRKDGTVITVLLSSSPIDLDDLSKGVTFAALDITDRKRAEEALRQSEERHRFLAENMGDIIWMLDKDLNTTYVSPSITRVLGFTPEQRKVQSLNEMLTPDSLAYIMEVFSEELAKDQDPNSGPDRFLTFEVEYFHKDGHTIWMENRIRAVRNEEGGFKGVYGVSRDITERRQAENEHEKLQAQFNQAQKMESVGRLAGGVAHDFNNMLNIIIGHVGMTLDDLSPDSPLRPGLEEVQTAAFHSADITHQLLAFARKQAIVPKVLDLNQTVESTLKMLRRLIGENITLSWQPGPSLWPVKVDHSQIDQILANLCVNARDAIDGMGKLTIETGRVRLDEEYCTNHTGFLPGEFVMLTVSDNGHGMDKETRKNIFEPFFTTKEVGKGTGLGLSTVYGIIKQNNGFINVYSEPGLGTSIRIYLPRHAAKTTTMQLESVGKASAPQGSETILVVEDEPALLKMTTAMLKRQGYTVLSAAAPGEAIRLAREHAQNIHLLITDVVMPNMNGQDLAKKLSSISLELKHLFMSGYPASMITRDGMLDEGVHYIQKPFVHNDLASKVREVLDERK